MIVRDEADRLPSFIQALKGVPDEVLLADTGSVDGTPEVARSLGARVEAVPWEEDFAAARNRAVGLARHDWVLVLDADERVDPEALAAFRARRPAGAAGYLFEVRNWDPNQDLLGWVPAAPGDPLGAGADGYVPARLVRCFARSSAARFEGRVHELVEPSLRRSGGRVEDSGLVIHHYGRLQDPARLQEKRGRYLALARRRVEEEPRSVKARLDLGASLFELGRPEEARDAFAGAVGLDPAQADSRCLLGVALLALGRAREAARELARAARGAPEALEPRLNLALALERTGRPRRALGVLGPARAAAPGHPVLLHVQGCCLLRLGRVEEAKETLRRAVRAHPRYVRAIADLGAAYLRQGELVKAAAAYELALGVDPGLPGALLGLGVVRSREGRLDEASALLERARSADPGDARVQENLGVVRLEAGDVHGAREALGRAVELDENSYRAHLALGAACQRLGDARAAAEALSRAAALDPSSGEPLYRMGQVAAAQGDMQAAAVAFQQALARDPRHSRALGDMGAILGQAGDLAGAASLFLRAVDSDPRDGGAWLNLAVALLKTRPPEPRRAREAARRACRLGQHVPDEVADRLASSPEGAADLGPPPAAGRRTVVFLLATTAATGGARAVMELACRMAARGHRVALASQRGAEPAWFDLPLGCLAICDLAAGVIEGPVDVVVASSWTLVGRAIRLARALGAIPVHLVHGDEVLLGDAATPEAREAAARARNALALPVPCLAASRRLAALLGERYRVRAPVVPNGVDTACFRPGSQDGGTRAGVLVVGSERLPFKRVGDVLEAVERLRGQGRVLDLVQVSPLPRADWAVRRGFHHAPPPADYRGLVGAADLLAVGSEFESFCLPALEAMASGTPVVSTRNGGVEEYAVDGQNALLVPVGDVEGLARAMARVLDESPLRTRLVAEGLRTAAAWTWDASARRMEEELDSLEARRGEVLGHLGRELPRQARAYQAWGQAVEAVRARRWAEAVARYDEVISCGSVALPEAHFDRARCLEAQGRRAEAAEAFRACAAELPAGASLGSEAEARAAGLDRGS